MLDSSRKGAAWISASGPVHLPIGGSEDGESPQTTLSQLGITWNRTPPSLRHKEQHSPEATSEQHHLRASYGKSGQEQGFPTPAPLAFGAR